MAWFDFVCASDTHGEIIDADYSKYILKFVEDVKPKKRFHLGDVFDLKPLRAGAHAEDRASSLKDDISAGLRFLRAFKPHVLTWGNHDHRLELMASSMREGLEFDYARQLKAGAADWPRFYQFALCRPPVLHSFRIQYHRPRSFIRLSQDGQPGRRRIICERMRL